MTPAEGRRDTDAIGLNWVPVGHLVGYETVAEARERLALPPADERMVDVPSPLSVRRAAITAVLAHEQGFPGVGDCSPEELALFDGAATSYLDAAGVPPLLDRLARLDGVEEDRDRWRTAWDEERRARVAAESAGSTASADAIRLRAAVALALDELQALGRPAAKVIADAAGTLANALEGRPLAAARPAPKAPAAPEQRTTGGSTARGIVAMAIRQLTVTPDRLAVLVAMTGRPAAVFDQLAFSVPEEWEILEGFREVRTPAGGRVLVVVEGTDLDDLDEPFIYREVRT